MSLAIYAAPFNENSSSDENNLINQKRQHNKTIKKLPKKEGFNTQKVNNVLEHLHTMDSEDDSGELGDFNPPPPPSSAGVNKTNALEEVLQKNNKFNKDSYSINIGNKIPQPYDSNSESNNDLSNYTTSTENMEYYKKMIPNFDETTYNNINNRPYYNQSAFSGNLDQSSLGINPSNEILLQKLNYMIHLLEESKDEKTNNVTEEVILYSFLGIFIIFIVDSFVKVGKYVR